jgi:hypothetical protein
LSALRPTAPALFAAAGVAILAAGILVPAPVAAAWIANGNPVCVDAGNQSSPVAVADGAGGAYVAWQDNRRPPRQIFVQRIDSAGNVAPGWSVGGAQVSSETFFDATATESDWAAPDGAGGVFLAWQRYNGTAWEIRLQRITSAGAPAPGWPAGGVLVDDTDVNSAVLAEDGMGGVYVGWWKGGGSLTLHLQHVDGTGAASWAAGGVLVSALDGFYLLSRSLIPDGTGGAMVAWLSPFPAAPGDSADVRIQRITSAGTVAAGWPANGVVAAADLAAFGLGPETPTWTPDDAGGAYVAWADARDGELDAYLTRIDASGGFAAGWSPTGNPIAANGSVQERGPVGLAADGIGGTLAMWNEIGGTFDEYRATHFAGSGLSYWGPNLAAQQYHEAFWGGVLPIQSSTGDWMAAGPAGGVAHPNVLALGLDVFGTPTAGWLGQTLRSHATPAAHERVTEVEPDVMFVAFSDARADSGDIYVARFESRCNLSATDAFTGWDSAVVPRSAAGAAIDSVALTPVLDGNSPTTWINWQHSADGTHTLPGWGAELRLDDETILFSFPKGSGTDPSFYTLLNGGPFQVRGGRHCLVAEVDAAGGVPETTEGDNVLDQQWIWSPLVTAGGAPLSRAAPPNPCVHVQPSGDGFSFLRNGSYAWVTAIAPRAYGDDYDLYVYDDYAGSTSGFSNLVGSSIAGGNQTDFVVGHFAGTPVTVYPAATRWSVGGGGQDFTVDQIDATGRNASEFGLWTGQLLVADRLADVYEANLTAGKTYTFRLQRESGTSDLAMDLYPGTAATIAGRYQALEYSAPISADHDAFVHTAVTTGWHPFVVYRTDGSTSSTPVTYAVEFGQAAVDAPGALPPGPPAALALHGARPNPLPGSGSLRFDLPAPGAVRLNVYDVSGRLVRQLVSGVHGAGRHDVVWDGRSGDGAQVGPGVYWARLEAQGETRSRKLVLLR